MEKRQLKEKLRLKQNNKCYYCKTDFFLASTAHSAEEANKWPELDHIIPKSIGGSDLEENLVVSCRECNQKKSNKFEGKQRIIRKPFTWIHNLILDNKNLNASDVIVYITLARFTDNQTQKCYPSKKLLIDYTHLTFNTITKSINKLFELNLIYFERGKGGKRNHYQLLEPIMTEKDPQNLTPQNNQSDPSNKAVATPQNTHTINTHLINTQLSIKDSTLKNLLLTDKKYNQLVWAYLAIGQKDQKPNRGQFTLKLKNQGLVDKFNSLTGYQIACLVWGYLTSDDEYLAKNDYRLDLLPYNWDRAKKNLATYRTPDGDLVELENQAACESFAKFKRWAI